MLSSTRLCSTSFTVMGASNQQRDENRPSMLKPCPAELMLWCVCQLQTIPIHQPCSWRLFDQWLINGWVVIVTSLEDSKQCIFCCCGFKNTSQHQFAIWSLPRLAHATKPTRRPLIWFFFWLIWESVSWEDFNRAEVPPWRVSVVKCDTPTHLLNWSTVKLKEPIGSALHRGTRGRRAAAKAIVKTH